MPIIILSFNVFDTEKKNCKSVINENKLGKVQVYFNMETATNSAKGGIYRIFGMFLITAEEADEYANKYQDEHCLKKSDWKELFQSNREKYIWPRYYLKLEQKMATNPTIKENIQSMIGDFDLDSCDSKGAQLIAHLFEERGETYFVKPNVKHGQDEDGQDDELEEDGEIEVIEVDDATEPDQDEDQKNQERKEFQDEEDPNDPDDPEYKDSDEEDEDSVEEDEDPDDPEYKDSDEDSDEEDDDPDDPEYKEESDSDEDSDDEDAAFRTPKRRHQAVQPMAPRKQSAHKRKIQPRSSDPQTRKQGRTLVYEF